MRFIYYSTFKWRRRRRRRKKPDLTKMNTSTENVVGSFRDALPTHFSFKISSFSNLATSSMKKYDSNVFEAGGYKWRLLFYPNGNSTDNGENHISMYLEMVETSTLPPGWLADVFFRFFVHDRIRDTYLILGDMGGRTRRFHEMMTVWGDSRLLPLATLNDSANGYLVDDTCIFGAEVFPCKNTGIGDCLTMVQSPSCVEHEWKIENFSSIREEALYSEVFTAGDHKWKIRLYPKGQPAANKEYLSLFLELDNSVAPAPGEKIYAGFKLRLKGQLNNLHKEVKDHKWFQDDSSLGWGSWGILKLIKLVELNDQTKGFLVNDTCIIEAEVTVCGVVKKLSST